MKRSYIFLIFSPVALTVLIIIATVNGCTNNNFAFYNKILNDFETDSYFIAVNLKTPSYKGRAIIENNNLYDFLRETKGFNKTKYQSLMIRTLVHHRTLKINIKANAMLNFIKVSEVENVLKVANQGENSFISHYFDGIMLKYGISTKEESAIINQLFYWGIPAKIDKISNNVIIG